MDIENRYRRGIFLAPQENHQMIYNRVCAINTKLHHIDEIIDGYKKSIAKFETYQKEVNEAKRILGIETNFNGDLLAITEKLISECTDRESEIWQAMWDVKKFQKRQSEYEKVLLRYSNLLEHRQHHVDLGWPTQWPDPFCEFWLELGGTPQTASAWANAGWWPETVLVEDIYGNQNQMTVTERLQCLVPPAMLKIVDDALDCPDEYERDVVA